MSRDTGPIRHIGLDIRSLPPTEVGPNKQRQSWKQRAPLVEEIKRKFSMHLEELCPRGRRPDYPFDLVSYDIGFYVHEKKRTDLMNLFGRMKAWEDVLVADGILAEDNIKVVHKVRLEAFQIPNDSQECTMWRIFDDSLLT